MIWDDFCRVETGLGGKSGQISRICQQSVGRVLCVQMAGILKSVITRLRLISFQHSPRAVFCLYSSETASRVPAGVEPPSIIFRRVCKLEQSYTIQTISASKMRLVFRATGTVPGDKRQLSDHEETCPWPPNLLKEARAAKSASAHDRSADQENTSIQPHYTARSIG
jgi:hypothetical protein